MRMSGFSACEAGAVSSFHRRHDELSRLRFAGPAARDSLEALVKTHAFHAMHRMIGKTRAPPAAKAHERHRHGYGYVDADHADFDRLHECARGAAVAREHGRSVGELMRIHELHRIRECRYAHHHEHGTKNLLAIDAHRRRHMIKETAAEEESALVVLE